MYLSPFSQEQTTSDSSVEANARLEVRNTQEGRKGETAKWE